VQLPNCEEVNLVLDLDDVCKMLWSATVVNKTEILSQVEEYRYYVIFDLTTKVWKTLGSSHWCTFADQLK